MDKDIWGIAIRSTGPVAVVALLVWTLINKFFLPEVLSLFGSYQAFLLTFLLISGLLVILLAAVLKHKRRETLQRIEPAPANNLTVNNSNVKGDVILGNKKELKK